jgi:cyclic beta-1,2-glucan synthetase
VEGAWLVLDPCIPRAWPGFDIVFRHRTACYEIHVENPAGVSRGIATAELDGLALTGAAGRLALVDDGKTHHVRIVLG